MTKPEKCKGPECVNRGRKSSGLCDSHKVQRDKGRTLTPLRSYRASGHVRDAQGRKRCTSCLQWMPEEFFSPNGRTPDRLRTHCKRCVQLKSHGLTPEQYRALLSAQGGACAICDEHPEGPLFIDHDHACCPGMTSCGDCVRGLLCNQCNTVLGMAQDNVDRLRSAISYLNGGKGLAITG